MSGCISIKFESEREKSSPVEPSREAFERTDAILDRALVFLQKSEEAALAEGRPLSNSEMSYARQLGVQHPEKVRIHHRFRFPKPEEEPVLAEFNRLGFGSVLEGGRTNGYGILIKSYFPSKHSIIRHELVHVKQMESMGQRAFLRQYLVEAMTYDYFDMPLEAEAFDRTDGERY